MASLSFISSPPDSSHILEPRRGRHHLPCFIHAAVADPERTGEELVRRGTRARPPSHSLWTTPPPETRPLHNTASCHHHLRLRQSLRQCPRPRPRSRRLRPRLRPTSLVTGSWPMIYLPRRTWRLGAPPASPGLLTCGAASSITGSNTKPRE